MTSAIPQPVKALMRLLPKDLHIVYCPASLPYLMVTNGRRVAFVVFERDYAVQDANPEGWTGAGGRSILPARAMDSVAEWMRRNMGASFPFGLGCWLPGGTMRGKLPPRVVLGSADKVASGFEALLASTDDFLPTPQTVKRLIGIAINAKYDRCPELLASMLGQSFYRDPGTSNAPADAVADDGVLLLEASSGRRKDVSIHVAEMQKEMRQPKRLAGDLTLHRVDEIAAGLFLEAPWMRDAIIALADDLRCVLEAGNAHVRFDPVLLLGPSGCGKSWLGRRLGELCDVPSNGFDASVATSKAPFTGMDDHWKGGGPSVALSTIVEHGAANPIVVVDEIDKAEAGYAESLLPLLEVSTASRFHDPYLAESIDMSYVNWVLTANDLERVPIALRDRCRILRVERPSKKDLKAFVRRQCDLKGFAPEVAEIVLEGLKGSRNLSLRSVQRALKAVDKSLQRPVVH